MRPIGQHDRAGQLGCHPLHALADPPRRIRGERRVERAVVALCRLQDTQGALLKELVPLDAVMVPVLPGDPGDQRSHHLQEVLARLSIPLGRRLDKGSFAADAACLDPVHVSLALGLGGRER